MTLPQTEPYVQQAYPEQPSRPALAYSDGVRYGITVTATVLGGYLLSTASIGQFVQAMAFGGAPELFAVLLLLRYVFAVAVLAIGFLLAPTSTGRRLLAAGIVVIGGIVFAVLIALRLTGGLSGPPAMSIVLHPAFFAVLLATAGWLIVRGRPAISFLLLLATLLVGFVPFGFALAGIESAMAELVVTPLALLVGVGIAWAARGIAAASHR